MKLSTLGDHVEQSESGLLQQIFPNDSGLLRRSILLLNAFGREDLLPYRIKPLSVLMALISLAQ